jgi:hypothetical protein
MGLNPNAVSLKCRTQWTTEVTNAEIFAAKVKLAGALLLIVVDSLILMAVGFPP